MDNISNLILQKRKERGLTQSELGAMLGISGKAVSKWERGLSVPCEEHLKKLIDLLGLPVEQKIAKSEQPPTFLSTVKSELIRILSAGVMIAVCICNMAGIISTDSTLVSLGFPRFLGCSFLLLHNDKSIKENRCPDEQRFSFINFQCI